MIRRRTGCATTLSASAVVKPTPKNAERAWKLPDGLLPGKVGYHAVQQDRMLKDGKLNAYWIMCNNNLQTAPNTGNETYPGYRNPENLIVCSDAYPTVTAIGRRLGGQASQGISFAT